MAHTAKTLLLSSDWDLVLNPEGNLSCALTDLAIAQNCANEIKLWTNDAYFQKDNGIEWQEVQLSQKYGSSLLYSALREACERVAGVAEVSTIEITEFDIENRILHGNIEIKTENSTNVTVDF